VLWLVWHRLWLRWWCGILPLLCRRLRLLMVVSLLWLLLLLPVLRLWLVGGLLFILGSAWQACVWRRGAEVCVCRREAGVRGEVQKRNGNRHGAKSSHAPSS